MNYKQISSLKWILVLIWSSFYQECDHLVGKETCLFISIFVGTSTGPGAPAAPLPLVSVHPRMPRGQSDGISTVHYVSRCIMITFFFFFFFLKRRWIIQTSTPGRKGSVSPCTRTLKSNPKENPTGVGVRLFPSRNASGFFVLFFFFFLQEAAETVAGPSMWVAASPRWLIPLINRFTETYSRRSTRLRPELIVGVKERVSKFGCQQLKPWEMLPSERLNNISSLNLPTSVQSIPLLYPTESSLFSHFSVTEVALFPSVWGPSHHANDFDWLSTQICIC